MPEDETQDLGIDKQKVVREITAPKEQEAPAESGGESRVEEPHPSIWRVLRFFSDEIALLLTLVIALGWIAAGLVLGHPLPLAIGGILLLPAVIGLVNTFRERE